MSRHMREQFLDSYEILKIMLAGFRQIFVSHPVGWDAILTQCSETVQEIPASVEFCCQDSIESQSPESILNQCPI